MELTEDGTLSSNVICNLEVKVLHLQLQICIYCQRKVRGVMPSLCLLSKAVVDLTYRFRSFSKDDYP